MTETAIENMTPQHCPAGQHPDWASDTENTLACPWCEIDRLRREARENDRALSQTIDERDSAQDMADKLAYAIAPLEVIGEHSSGNCPWENALEEVHRLRDSAPSA
jgi:hypothetical protein